MVADADADAAPTSSSLLDLSNLPPSASPDERQLRLATLQSWCFHYNETMIELLTSSEHRDVKTGCMPLHWLAGTGFDEAIESILHHYADLHLLSVDQHAHHPSTHRTPLHYAARNGHLSTCELLIEKYGANSHPKCGRGNVTPLQLAVWQNRLTIVRYLIEKNGVHVVHERNGFNCGLMHWIGLVPAKRWGGDDHDDTDENDGSGVLPLARYLHSLGVVYSSTANNSNTQGHTPNHKAAWGGNLPLLQYFRDTHGVYDTVQDAAGNYAADIAKMRGNKDCHQWLLEHGSGARAASYRALGLNVGADLDAVRRRYFELARAIHPDKATQQCEIDDEKKEEIVDDFVKIKTAYEHLTKEGGVGQQKNPKFDELKLLEDHKRMQDESNAETNDIANDDIFMARLIAILSDYGEDGFPVSLIARRWNQIWPDRPFPNKYVIERRVRCSNHDGDGSGMMLISKKANLLKWLKWKRDQCNCKSVYFCNRNGVVLAFNRTKQPSALDPMLPKEKILTMNF
jgi:ankyrin repeat protein